MCPWSSSPNVAGTYYLLRTGETSYPSYFFCIKYNVLEHWLRDSDQIFRRTERVSIRLARVNVGSVLFVRVRVRLLGLFYLLALSRVFSILLAKYLYYSFFYYCLVAISELITSVYSLFVLLLYVRKQNT